MDALHVDLVIHILSFLPGNRLLQLKQLNSYFQWIIKKKRFYLQYPKFTMHIIHVSTEYRDEMEIIDVNLYRLPHCNNDWGTVSCQLNFKDPHGVKVTLNKPYYGKWYPPLVYFYSNIFYPLTKDKTTLRNFFDFVLARGDIDVATSSIENPVIFQALAESIKYSTSQIRTIKMSPYHFNDIKCLLTAVSSHKRHNARYPRLEVSCSASSLYKKWATLKSLNDIATGFSKARLQFNDENHEKVTDAIKEHWKVDPFLKMNFSLRIGRFNSFNSAPWNNGKYYRILLDEKTKSLAFEEKEDTILTQLWEPIKSTIAYKKYY